MKISTLFNTIIAICISLLLSGCSGEILEISLNEVKATYEKSSTKKSENLGQKTVLYLDHSTCVIDAVNNSEVWKSLFSNFTQYSDELVLIKGNDFERILLKNKHTSLI